jgi:hypothetical protein
MAAMIWLRKPANHLLARRKNKMLLICVILTKYLLFPFTLKFYSQGKGVDQFS